MNMYVFGLTELMSLLVGVAFISGALGAWIGGHRRWWKDLDVLRKRIDALHDDIDKHEGATP